MGDTKIEWTEKTWNPIRARRVSNDERGWYCEHVSEGCRNCYAEKMNRNTYFGNGLEYKPVTLDQVDLFLDDKILQQPLHWTKPQNVFPCSMTDLFGRWVKDEWLDRVFAVMALAKQHTFQVLTKRPDRMLAYMTRLSRSIAPLESAARALGHTFKFKGIDAKEYSLLPWPIPNVWAGTSCEDQKTADERIPLLLQTPAAVRWISAEPLLGPVDLSRYRARDWTLRGHDHPTERTTGIDWVVVGGESGPGARPMHPDWARSLRDQCVAAGVPFFFKQWGEWTGGIVEDILGRQETKLIGPDSRVMVKVGKKAAGRLLDGREWSEYPKAKTVAAV